MIELGNNASRNITDTHLSRYACYLVMQNADPSKEVVALGQTYFAIQTRKQEIQDQAIEDQKRLVLRGEITSHNKHLAETAAKAGVKNYGVFLLKKMAQPELFLSLLTGIISLPALLKVIYIFFLKTVINLNGNILPQHFFPNLET